MVGTSDVNKSGVELTADYNLITSDIQPVEKIINEIRGQKNPADNVVTTLNANLQQVAHDTLGDREGAVVAIEPSTGKVLAMISKPETTTRIHWLIIIRTLLVMRTAKFF